jgi:glutamate/tyrosine decarboxylase-like PLP-dependent enzyme
MSDQPVLPLRRRRALDVMRQLNAYQAEDLSWDDGNFGIWWPSLPPDVFLVARDAFAQFAHMNGGFGEIPSLTRVNRELRAMVADVLRAPSADGVTITGGGTESNFLAMKTARDWARERGQLTERPNIVVPYTAHPSFDKHADTMGLTVVRVPVAGDFRADPAALAEAVTDDTFMLAGSMPSYSHGVADPIAALAALARERGIWMHVDACVGGFLHPFFRRLGRRLPEFDFTVDGVDSIAADLHKFGYCLNGISTFTLRDEAHREYQRYAMSNWPHGSYVRYTFGGSRSGAPIAAAWAVMQYLGEEGYLDIARRILHVTEQMAAGIRDIPGLELVCEPELGVIAITSRELSVPRLAVALRRRGPSTYLNAEPPAIHLLMDPVDDLAVDRYLEKLALASGDVRSGRVTDQAVAAYTTE